MTAALETTYEILSSSRNESVVPVLIGALDSKDGRVYEAAIRTLVARRSKAGHLAVLKRWHLLSPQQRELILEGRGRMSGAMRDAVLSDDDQLFKNACFFRPNSKHIWAEETGICFFRAVEKHAKRRFCNLKFR